MIAKYFEAETAKLEGRPVADIQSLEQWKTERPQRLEELKEMLGLMPWPEKTDLKVTYTGEVDHEEFTVKNLHYQSRPGLYVTGNLYIPKNIEGEVPAILYVCGHGKVKKGDVSYGNKTYYQHHGAWFARHGMVCLTIDTLQLGEIEGIHHGTYKYDMWWWNNRGYTPAGVEAWNCVRALDLLQSLPEVNDDKLGVTGRSGGGAYSWWVAALDDRIKAAVPVAGITDLRNHVVDGCVEGHCDCMFWVNTYRWDYSMLAAMVAPRPLMISNTDSDGIFPLDGVTRTYFSTRKIYSLYNATDDFALSIAPGPHKDTQQLRVPAFHWLREHLQGESPLIEVTAEKQFEVEQLRVFDTLPKDEKNTTIHESFTVVADEPEAPSSTSQWNEQSESWKAQLKKLSFAAWPKEESPVAVKEISNQTASGIRVQQFVFTSQDNIQLKLIQLGKADAQKPKLAVLNIVDDQGWQELQELVAYITDGVQKETASEEILASVKMLQNLPWQMVYIAPRGLGETQWNQDPKKQIQIRRRFQLLGQTLDGMRVYDTRRAIQAWRSIKKNQQTSLWLQASGNLAGIAVYASLFEPNITRLDLYELANDHRNGPEFLNVRRFMNLPEAVAMAAENSQVVIYSDDEKVANQKWSYPASVVKSLDWPAKNLQLRTLKSE
ncbi:MAG: acetylxylan esterase [Blastopirellula sp.]|nr:MAG: acetylxylan esterase [Blastopirellula sp.]